MFFGRCRSPADAEVERSPSKRESGRARRVTEVSRPPPSHTTVRTVPYTAVHEVPLSLLCRLRRLTSPIWSNVQIGTAWFMWLAPAFHHGPRPLEAEFFARS